MTSFSSTRVLLLLLLLVLGLAACGSAELTGFTRQPLPEVGDQALPDVATAGDHFRLEADPEGLLVVYFGYTSCPDVCPTTLADLRAAVRKLGSQGEQVDVAMATVDPNRDTEEIITGYVRAFFDTGHALRTEDDAELRGVAEAFGATYSVEQNDEGEIEVVHTSHLYVVDDEGFLRVTWPFGTTSDDMAQDLQILLRET